MRMGLDSLVDGATGMSKACRSAAVTRAGACRGGIIDPTEKAGVIGRTGRGGRAGRGGWGGWAFEDSRSRSEARAPQEWASREWGDVAAEASQRKNAAQQGLSP